VLRRKSHPVPLDRVTPVRDELAFVSGTGLDPQSH
jgi:hypothetical protein